MGRIRTKTLTDLLDIQYRASGVINGVPPAPTRTALAQYALALIVEVGELVQRLNWKPWKKDQPVDRDAVLDELADVWAFTLLYTNLVMEEVGATPEEVQAAYLRKVRLNIGARANGKVPGYGRKEAIDGKTA